MLQEGLHEAGDGRHSLGLAAPRRRLETLGIDFPFMIAPMVGISHVAFRELIKSYTPVGINALRFTEMLSTRKIPTERLSDVFELQAAPGESHFIPQILGNEERFIQPSLKRLSELNPWGYDINMGCPVSHTLRHNWGVKLLGDAAYAAEVVAMTKRHTNLPVSVKLRGGSGDGVDTEFLLGFTEALENAGADWLTVHARGRGQGHKGLAHWAAAGEVARARKIPVVVNGDIQTAHDAVTVLDQHGVDGVMIARAATARPWILWQIAQRLGMAGTPPGREGERAPATLEEESKEYFRALATYAELLDGYTQDVEYGLRKFRFYVLTSAKWFSFGHAFWKRTLKVHSLKEMAVMVREYGEAFEFPMYERVQYF